MSTTAGSTLIDYEEIADTRAAARDLATKYIAPRAAEIDETELFPHDIVQRFVEAGLLALVVPAEYGGVGGGIAHVAAVGEELAAVDVSSAITFNGHSSCVSLLDYLADDDQKARYFEKVVDGALLSIALTEPGAGSDAGAITTSARRDGDHYLLNGTKQYCTNADVAGIILVFAVTDGSLGSRGISLFAVSPDNPGLHVQRHEKKMGLHGTSTIEFTLEDCMIDAADRIGPENGGFRAAMNALQKGRVGVAAVAIGAAHGAIEYTAEHVKTREQFGAPLAHLQGVQFALADLQIQTSAARALLRDAIQESLEDAPTFAATSAAIKCFATDTAMRVATDCVQLLGGLGYMRGCPVERVMRDVKILQIFEGANDLMRVLVARGLLGKASR